MNYKRLFLQNSYVHIIIVAYNRMPIFVNNINLLRKSFENSKKYFIYEIVAICVLPNHIHLILKPENIKDYPKIITSIKYYFSRNYNKASIPTRGYIKKGEKGVFQRRYFEHTIVNQQDFENQINYVHYNPVKHGIVQNVKDWKYSSFHKHVKQGLYNNNWGSLSDIKIIQNLEFE